MNTQCFKVFTQKNGELILLKLQELTLERIQSYIFASFGNVEFDDVDKVIMFFVKFVY